MTINSETRVAGPFDGNDSTVSFPFTFKVFDSDEVRVVAETGAIETDLELGTDYTVVLNADQNAAPGGSVVLAAPLPTGTRLTLTSALEMLQPVDLTNQGGFYPRVINSALDRLTILLQQLASVVSRTLKFPLSDGPVGDLPGRSARAGTVLAFDEATGEPVAGPDISSVNGVAGALVAINTVSNNIVDVNTVADNIADLSNFSGVYYGPSATDPTTRRDGSPLQVGDLYFNTFTDALRTYNGTAWRESVSGVVTVQNLSGDGVRTQFPLNYAPESEVITHVFIGGAYQQKNTYELGGANGNVLIFNEAPAAGTDNIEVVVSSLTPSDDKLRQELAEPTGGATLIATPSGGVVADVFSEDAQKGSALIPYRSSAATPSSQTIKDKLDQFELPADSLGGKAGAVLRVLEGNWPAATGSGGRSYFFNPDSVDTAAFSKNSVVVLGGRGPSYLVTVGANAELAFHGGGGDTLLDHLAGTVCGGAHHKMTKNNAATPTGSHGFIGGGSYQEVYGDYAVVVGGTLNKNHAIKATIVGGDSNRIGNITDQSVGRNGFIGGGYLNTMDGQYAWIPSGQLCKAQKDYSSAWGYSARSSLYGTMANSSGKFSVDGDNNTLRGRLRRVTTDGIPTQLLLDGSSQALVMGRNTLWTGRVLISALRTDTVETASYSLTFSAYCDSSVVVTIKSQSLTVLHEDNSSYNVDVTASGSNVSIRAIGVAASNIRWSASFEIDELRNI
jgi:hypothetical protein